MKKPAVGKSDKLRALTEDQELRALMERYYAATPEKRDRILDAFAKRARELHPDWRETIERSDGGIVRALFIHDLKEARAWPDLTEFEQLQIKNLEAEFVTIFDTVSATSPVVGEPMFKLASVVQQMARIARFGPRELSKLTLRAVVEGGKRGGKNSGKVRSRENKPWAPHATELAIAIDLDLPVASDEDIAFEIKAGWKLDSPPSPGVRTLTRFVSDLRNAGKLPKRAKRRGSV
jgi:hypothetical protein